MNETSAKTIRNAIAIQSSAIVLVTAIVIAFLCVSTANAQVSPEEHAQHHPEQAGGKAAGSGMRA
ncbi:MAG: hypothetical protein HKN47_06250, partial [Pirellulaceae bacterium]|nr:hypothetical protein [Pirellulaceae bacterium]